jgi:HEAT repeat protein
MRWTAVALTLAACSLLLAAEPDAAAQDEATLKAAGLASDGPALVEFFKKRAATDAARARAAELVKQLGDDDFGVREKASAALVSLGRAALPALKAGVDDGDAEVARRAAECLRLIETDAATALASAAARLVALRKPDGAAEVLLAYLPCADGETADEEARTALAAVTLRGGRPDPAVVKALEDADPVRRGAAAEALCRAGAKESLPAVRKLLADRDPRARLRAALALAALKERDAVPALIGLLAELPPEQGWRAEDVLQRLAGDGAPLVSLAGDEAARKKCRDAWADWWKKHGEKADLARLDPGQALLGYTAMIVFENNGTGRAFEVGRDGKRRWEIPNLQNPVDVRVVPGGRVLIAEHGSNRVTERTFKGDVVWQHEVNSPILCQRLPNGNTFIVTASTLIEVDPKGKVVLNLTPPNGARAAHKYPDGTIGLVGSDNATWKRLDASGKELKSVAVQVQISNGIGGVEFLRDGRLLVTQGNKVVEYDADGKVVWQADVPQAYPLSRAPNGHTLVATTAESRFVELNREGKIVWEHKVQGTPWIARRR